MEPMAPVVPAAVRAYCDNMIAHARDDYGPRKLRVFVNGYDIYRRV